MREIWLKKMNVYKEEYKFLQYTSYEPIPHEVLRGSLPRYWSLSGKVSSNFPDKTTQSLFNMSPDPCQ